MKKHLPAYRRRPRQALDIQCLECGTIMSPLGARVRRPLDSRPAKKSWWHVDSVHRCPNCNVWWYFWRKKESGVMAVSAFSSYVIHQLLIRWAHPEHDGDCHDPICRVWVSRELERLMALELL